jgi:hypothetical protein
VQIQAELRKQPGVVWPEVKHRTARAVPLALPASPCRLHSRLSLGTCNYIGVAQAARWVQTVAELRKRPGECNLAELRKQPGDVWPEVNHRTARAVPLASPAYAVAVIFETYESQRAALKFV